MAISPSLLEIAEIAAEDSGMALREYLEIGLTLVIKTHAEKLGLNKKTYVTEYRKEHSTVPITRVSTRKR